MFRFDTLRVSLTWPRAALVGVLLFGGADLAQRKLLPPHASDFHLKVPHSRSVNETAPGLLPGIFGDSCITINALGIRGPELPRGTNTYRILCIGDSVTECIRLDDAETWPALVMQRLNREPDMPRVWVGNAGQSGYPSFYTRHFLTQTELIKSLDCVVVLTGTADLIVALSGSPELLQPSSRPKKRRSWIGTFLKDTRRKFKTAPGKDLATEDSKGRVYVARRDARGESEKTDEMPDLTAALARYRDHLRSIADVCRQNGVRLIFVTTASVCSKTLPPPNEDILWSGKLADGRYLSEAGLCEAIELYNNAMAAAARERGVDLVDTRSLNTQRRFFYDGWHFNEEGARRMAGMLADHFLAHRGPHRWPPAAQPQPTPAR